MNINLDNTRWIIFDLGGVLLNIDYDRTSRFFVDLGFDAFDAYYSQAKQDHVFDRFEKGEMSDQAFRDYIQNMSPKKLSNEQIDSAWNAMLLDFPVYRMELLEKLQQKFGLILMSNTNHIHIQAFEKIIQQSLGIHRFKSVFRALYYSSEIGKRKPDPATFQWILSENGLQADACFFIDDSIQHVEGCIKAGVPAYHLQSGEDITDLFTDYC